MKYKKYDIVYHHTQRMWSAMIWKSVMYTNKSKDECIAYVDKNPYEDVFKGKAT